MTKDNTNRPAWGFNPASTRPGRTNLVLASLLLAVTCLVQAQSFSGNTPNDPTRPFSEQLQAGLNALERKHYSTALR